MFSKNFVSEAKTGKEIELDPTQEHDTKIPLQEILALDGTSQRQWGERLSCWANS